MLYLKFLRIASYKIQQRVEIKLLNKNWILERFQRTWSGEHQKLKKLL